MGQCLIKGCRRDSADGGNYCDAHGGALVRGDMAAPSMPSGPTEVYAALEPRAPSAGKGPSRWPELAVPLLIAVVVAVLLVALRWALGW